MRRSIKGNKRPTRHRSDRSDSEDPAGQPRDGVRASPSRRSLQIKRYHEITTNSPDSTTSWIGSNQVAAVGSLIITRRRFVRDYEHLTAVAETLLTIAATATL